MHDVVAAFKQNNTNWPDVRVFDIDKHSGEKSVLTEAFPNARVLMSSNHVDTYLAKRVNELVTGSQDDKQNLRNVLQAMRSSETVAEYEKRKALLLHLLHGDAQHPFFVYFLKNWDGCRGEWVDYARQDMPYLGKNTNNRLEAKWGKLKQRAEYSYACGKPALYVIHESSTFVELRRPAPTASTYIISLKILVAYQILVVDMFYDAKKKLETVGNCIEWICKSEFVIADVDDEGEIIKTYVIDQIENIPMRDVVVKGD
ncbi:hypothetical protein P43SY_011799 [Pythium insidiosum]|uniref:ZSWIM1/3 RNaseH-like domain-containing protein n=1 Tax=Pythium insidiosum TaxID=114742 RepID=A0AAD5Q5S8_PYTIN|nr:hypothetical protein P43SY_011799 [Pythium insidiosum]